MKFKIVDASGLIEHHDTDAGTVTIAYERPSHVQPGCSAAAHDETPSIHHHSDRSLADLIVQQRRAIEDAERDGHDARVGKDDLRVLVALQRLRFRLRMRYGARDAYGPPGDRGTDIYDHWMRLDEPPSYWLAFQIDRWRFDQGERHIVAWSA